MQLKNNQYEISDKWCTGETCLFVEGTEVATKLLILKLGSLILICLLVVMNKSVSHSYYQVLIKKTQLERSFFSFFFLKSIQIYWT